MMGSGKGSVTEFTKMAEIIANPKKMAKELERLETAYKTAEAARAALSEERKAYSKQLKAMEVASNELDKREADLNRRETACEKQVAKNKAASDDLSGLAHTLNMQKEAQVQMGASLDYRESEIAAQEKVLAKEAAILIKKTQEVNQLETRTKQMVAKLKEVIQ